MSENTIVLLSVSVGLFFLMGGGKAFAKTTTQTTNPITGQPQSKAPDTTLSIKAKEQETIQAGIKAGKDVLLAGLKAFNAGKGK